MMELRVIEYFLTIAHEKSFSKAAEILHITQPTLSRQIKELEDELNVQLFIRSTHALQLTSDGMLFKQKAQEIIHLVRQTENQFKKHEEELHGTISIGASESKNNKIITDAMANMVRSHPNVHFEILSGNATQINEGILQGTLDLGIVIEPTDLTNFDFLFLPNTNLWGMWMKKDDELAKKEYITAEDLYPLPIILSSQEMVKNQIAGWLSGNQRRLNIVANYNLIYNGLLMVKSNLGYLLGLGGLYPESENSDLCFRPLEPKLEVKSLLIYKKYQTFPSHIECFLEYVLNEIKETLA